MADAASETTVEPVSILPSGKPADSVGNVSSKPSSIATLIAKSSERADAFLSHLFRCMQTRAGADAVLMFLCYSTRLTGSVLEIVGRSALKATARQLVATLFKLPPATTVVMASTTTPPAVALTLQLAGHLKAYSGMLSEMRCMGRLWGLLGLYFASKKLVLKSRQQASQNGASEKTTEEDVETGFDIALAYAQIISLVIFQASENVAYLSSKKVLPFSPATQGKLGLLSVRSWGLYVGMEVVRLLIERSRKQRSAITTKDFTWVESWKKAFLRNASWAPLTVHWGMVNGPLPDVLVSFFGAYPATSQMLELWKSTA